MKKTALCISAILIFLTALLSFAGCEFLNIETILSISKGTSEVYTVGESTMTLKISDEVVSEYGAEFSDSISADDFELPQELKGKTVSVKKVDSTHVEVSFSGKVDNQSVEELTECMISLKEKAFTKNGFHAYAFVKVGYPHFSCNDGGLFSSSGTSYSASFTLKAYGVKVINNKFTVENCQNPEDLTITIEDNKMNVKGTKLNKIDAEKPIVIVFDPSDTDMNLSFRMNFPETLQLMTTIYFDTQK